MKPAAPERTEPLVGQDELRETRVASAAPDRTEPHVGQELRKTLVALAFANGAFILSNLSLAIVHERLPDRMSYPPLPDVLDMLPPVAWALDVSEVLIIAGVLPILLLLLIHRYRWIVLRRLCLILGVLYYMRVITMVVTQVPIARGTPYCSPKANSTDPLLILKRTAKLMTGLGLSISGVHTFCGDYIYSGHTVILTLAYLVIREYSPRRCKALHTTYLVLSSVGIFMVLLSRGHYTVDVVIGYYVTTRVFWTYHTLANHRFLKGPSPNNHLARCWWFPLFSYFEKDVAAVVPRQYEWPLPQLRRWLGHLRVS